MEGGRNDLRNPFQLFPEGKIHKLDHECEPSLPGRNGSAWQVDRRPSILLYILLDVCQTWPCSKRPTHLQSIAAQEAALFRASRLGLTRDPAYEADVGGLTL
jgi:hypothetical protein